MDYIKSALKKGIIGMILGVFAVLTFIVLLSLLQGTAATIDMKIFTRVYFHTAAVSFICSAAFVVFDFDSLSDTKQFIIHCSVTFAGLFLSSILFGFISLSLPAVLLFILAFGVEYSILCFFVRMYWDRKRKKINALLRDQNSR